MDYYLEEPKKPILYKDLKILILSYLTLDEILENFHDDHDFRDQIIARGNYYIPSWDDIFSDNRYYVAEYLLQEGNLPLDINYALQYGNLQMLQLLHHYNIPFTKNDLDYTAFEGMDNIFEYLVSIGLRPNYHTYLTARKGLDRQIEYIDNTGNTLSLEGFEKILKYLEDIGLGN
jgi:hypothetical protein